MKFAAIYCLCYDIEYLDISLEAFKNIDKILFLVSDVPWNGEVLSDTHKKTLKHVKDLCAENTNLELVEGHWKNEADQRNFGLSKLFKEGYDYSFIVDSDEIYHDFHIDNITRFVMEHPQYVAFHLFLNTYWSKEYYVISPREDLKPVAVVKISDFLFTSMRNGITSIKRVPGAVLRDTTVVDYNHCLIPPEIAICYHLSYARDSAFIYQKMQTFSHAHEIIPGWYENIWEKWYPGMSDLHPVTPSQYKNAIKENFVSFPFQLQRFIKEERIRKHTGRYQCSIIVLNWNSCELLKRCLKLIEKNTTGAFYQVIIVDNGSTKDDSVEYLRSLTKESFIFPFMIIYNKENLGFPGGVNETIRRLDTRSDICLLNVDAEVQEGWLLNLYETLNNTPNCGLVGPLGNESNYQQEGMVEIDQVVPNLHFYCVLIFRELVNRIGLFDTRYGIGEYEDHDYCIRARLAGYTISVSAKSLVKHKPHQVFDLNGLDCNTYIDKNKIKFYEKFVGAMLVYSNTFDFYSAPLAKDLNLIIP